jgi:predicted RNA-binding protein with PUA-like domain
LARIVKTAYPDFHAYDVEHIYYDPKSTPEKPIWFMVDVGFVALFPNFVSLDTIKSNPNLADIMVAQKGSRLSIQPVSEEHFLLIQTLGGLYKSFAR